MVSSGKLSCPAVMPVASDTPLMRKTTRAYLQLLRPPNIVTAAADILAGYAAAGRPAPRTMVALVFSGMALYAGGVVLNDYFDRHLDARERPERPIPSGRVQPGHAAAVGAVFLAGAVVTAFFVARLSGILAAAIAVCALVYDVWAKSQAILGPVLMGCCRGGNLLLGISAVPMMCGRMWFLALVPAVYIAGVTSMSRGEVIGGNKRVIQFATVMFAAVFAAICLLGWALPFQLRWALIPLFFLGYRIAPGLCRAWRAPNPVNIRALVKSGVLSVVVLDAAIAAGFAGPWYGAGVLALLGFAATLAGPFAVT